MQTLSNLQLGASLRVIHQAGQPWFVAKDVCEVLGILQTGPAVDRLDDDEKGVNQIHTPGGVQKMWTVSESGLYALILRSDKPAAKAFRKWITSEVLPEIRQTGGYSALTARLDELKRRRGEVAGELRAIDRELTECKVTAARKIAATLGVEYEFDKITKPCGKLSAPSDLVPDPVTEIPKVNQADGSKPSKWNVQLAASLPLPARTKTLVAWMMEFLQINEKAARQRLLRLYRTGLVAQGADRIVRRQTQENSQS